MRRIGVITTGRADYGIYLPLLKRIQADPDIRLLLYVSGTHLDPRYGRTVDRIEADGFATINVPIPTRNESPGDTARCIGEAVSAFARTYAAHRPDILVALGDRHEMLGAVTASVPFNLPVAHIHGGETTEGAIDEAFRHAITKMSHLHFPATLAYARRIVRMGEDPWRVHPVGAPSLDNLADTPLMDRSTLEAELALDLASPPLLVTYHPVTTELDDATTQLDALFEALDRSHQPIVFTAPNADTGSNHIRERMEAFAGSHPGCACFTSLGTGRYFSLMKCSAAMVGNSSSGIIEAASFGLPVVDIGTRQRGRDHGANVLHAPPESGAIHDAIVQATSPSFRKSIAGMLNPYGNGQASIRILETLKSTPLTHDLFTKRFYDGEGKDAA